MAKPKTEKNPKGAGAPKKNLEPMGVIYKRVKLSYVAPLKKVVKEEIERLDNLNDKKQNNERQNAIDYSNYITHTSIFYYSYWGLFVITKLKTMDKDKTAVEWLFETMQSKLNNEMSVTFKEMFTEALALERKQIIDAFNNGAIDGSYGNKYKSAEQYYQTKYGEQS